MTVINDSESNSNEKNAEYSKWGYDMYPERRADTQNSTTTTSTLTSLFDNRGRDNIDKIRCERNVYKCIKQSPLIKLMMGALRKSGCNLDIRRHISCEQCSPAISGGFDPILNQVVICQNVVKKEGLVQAVLTHEMVHMFDYCENKLDFRNLEHLACTEIRAANLAHCSFLSGVFEGGVSVFNVKNSHRECVRQKALSSVMAARDVDKDTALAAIDKVFDRCYQDLEPLGRRLRRNSDDIHKAYHDGFYYGYNYDS